MKLPTIWTDEKHSQEEAEPGRNSDVEKVRREKIKDGESQGSLEAKLPTIWRDGKGTARKKLGRGESQKGEDKRWRRSEMEKVRREKMQVREKVGKSRNIVFFQCFVAPEGRKVGSLKRRVRR